VIPFRLPDRKCHQPQPELPRPNLKYKGHEGHAEEEACSGGWLPTKDSLGRDPAYVTASVGALGNACHALPS